MQTHCNQTMILQHSCKVIPSHDIVAVMELRGCYFYTPRLELNVCRNAKLSIIVPMYQGLTKKGPWVVYLTLGSNRGVGRH